MPDLMYDTAFLYYKMSYYSKAADLFTEVAAKDPSKIQAYYYAGISLFKQGSFHKALDYFISAAEKSPSLTADGYYYAGMCFYKLGEFENAKEKFEYVKGHAEDGMLKDNAVKWLQAAESRKKAPKPYSLFLKAGLRYDDNVRLEPLDREDFYADEDDYVAVAIRGAATSAERERLLTAGASLVRDQRAEVVLLGGTDLNLVYDGVELDFPVIDSAMVHVDAIVNAALAKS